MECICWLIGQLPYSISRCAFVFSKPESTSSTLTRKSVSLLVDVNRTLTFVILRAAWLYLCQTDVIIDLGNALKKLKFAEA